MLPCAQSRITGKERDSVNENDGLDYFGARYHWSRMGRFISPDSFSFSTAASPQSWNLYAYTVNNPLRYIDPTGHMPSVPNVSPHAYDADAGASMQSYSNGGCGVMYCPEVATVYGSLWEDQLADSGWRTSGQGKSQ